MSDKDVYRSWVAANRERVREHKRKYRMNNPDKHKATQNAARNKRRKDLLATLLLEQNSLCFLCECVLTEKTGQVDHSHECLHHKSRFYCEECIRGALCRKCNFAIGCLERSSAFLAPIGKAVQYLMRRPFRKKPRR